MGNKRVEGWPALGFVQTRDRGRTGGIGRQSVDGLGRQNDQPAAPKNGRRVLSLAQSWPSMYSAELTSNWPGSSMLRVVTTPFWTMAE